MVDISKMSLVGITRPRNKSGVKATPEPQPQVEIEETINAVVEVVKPEAPIKKTRAKKVPETPQLPIVRAIYKTYEDYPVEDLFLYAGFDCIVTSELGAKLMKDASINRPYTVYTGGGVTATETFGMSILESYERFTQPAFQFIVDIEMNGICYDVEGNKAMGAKMLAEVAELEKEIFDALGFRLNLDSGEALAKLLYVDMGFVVAARTKSGDPSTDGDALVALAKLHDLHWLKLVAKRKDIISVYRTFIENYVADFVKKDGRIHPSYNMHGTSSFRISGESPNLTQLPRAKWGYNVRDLYIVPKGHVFIALDFSSAEVKVLGAISKDPMLLKAIEDGMDFHAFSASQMYGLDYNLVMEVLGDDTHPLYKDYKGRRQTAKTLTFSILKY